jgi:hypothetical protein
VFLKDNDGAAAPAPKVSAPAQKAKIAPPLAVDVDTSKKQTPTTAGTDTPGLNRRYDAIML